MTQETEAERYIRRSEAAFERLALALDLSRTATLDQIVRAAEEKLEGFTDSDLDDFRKVKLIIAGAQKLGLGDNVVTFVESLIEKFESSETAHKRLEELDLPLKKGDKEPTLEELVEALATKLEGMESDEQVIYDKLDLLDLVKVADLKERPSLLTLVNAAICRIEELEKEQESVRDTLLEDAPAGTALVGLQALAETALDRARTSQVNGDLGRRIVTRLGG